MVRLKHQVDGRHHGRRLASPEHEMRKRMGRQQIGDDIGAAETQMREQIRGARDVPEQVAMGPRRLSV
jgi:hypothetical protein